MTFDPEVRDHLVQAAIQARRWAYAPYSKYAVGAALLTASGKIYEGVNIENAAYPHTICAERTAVFKAVSEGERQFTAIAVVTSNAGMPCGACRQALSEFCAPGMPVYYAGAGSSIVETTIGELLPADSLHDLKDAGA